MRAAEMQLFFYDASVTKFYICSYFETMIDLTRYTEWLMKEIILVITLKLFYGSR